jgi:uncharacterized protein (TIRG00374 family)
MTAGDDEAAEGFATQQSLEPATTDRSGRRLGRWGVIVVLLGAVAYTVLLTAPGLDESRAALARIAPVAVVVALAGEVVVVGSLGQVYRASLAALGGRIAYRHALNVSMSAFTVSQVLPAGGAFGALVAARRLYAFGASAAAATVAVGLYATLSLFTLAVLTALAVATVLFTRTLSPLLLLAIACVLALLAIAVWLVLAMVRVPGVARRVFDAAARVLRPFPVDVDRLRASFTQLSAQPIRPRRLLVVMAWCVLRWVAELAGLWALFRGLGYPLDLVTLMVGFGVEHVVLMVPVSPGGLGLVEAGMAGVFTALGVPASIAVTAVLAYRIVSYWLPVLAGVPQYLRGPRGPLEEPGAQDEPAPREDDPTSRRDSR